MHSLQEDEREAASALREHETARGAEPEPDRATSEGQPIGVAGATRQSGASAGHRANARMAEQPWKPGNRVNVDPLREHPCELSRGTFGGRPPFSGRSITAAVLPTPFAGGSLQSGLEADAQGAPSTPCGPVGPLPEPDLGFERRPATPPAKPDSPLTHAHSAAALRAGLPSVARLRVEALAGHAQSFTTGAKRGGAAGGLDDRETLRARARAGELRSLMALHVYEHGVEEIAKVVTDYQ